ncbi:MAG: hydroxyphenylacetyl-CoA thioesterase PaaI [Candidatus Bathyarchaeia archaeon]
MEAELNEIRKKVESDRFSKSLGIELLDLKRGYSKMAMTVRDDMLNFHGIAHGGSIFSLADAAFAAASNSHGQQAIALSMTINYRSPAEKGVRLVAEGVEESLGRRTGLYRMEVRTEEGVLIASAQGTVYRREEKIT